MRTYYNTWVIIGAVMAAAFWLAAVYVVIHFIIKFW